MEFNELKVGTLIKWTPHFIRANDPIIILIDNIGKDHRGVNYVDTQILSGTTYSNLYYNNLLTPSHNVWGYTRIYEPQFNKHKNDITISNSNDLVYIENRLNEHVNSYKIEYMRQKTWAKDLLKKSKEFYDNI